MVRLLVRLKERNIDSSNSIQPTIREPGAMATFHHLGEYWGFDAHLVATSLASRRLSGLFSIAIAKV
jgi:hypothetical protein